MVMKKISIKRGLDLPIKGRPIQEITDRKSCKRVALLGEDYVGMRPTLLVKVGDRVKVGQAVFSDKKLPRVLYTAPGAGTVAAINRGEKRFFLSLVIELTGEAENSFDALTADELNGWTREQVVERLLETGEWPALRMRPFSKVANPDQIPHSIFINLMDSQPLAPQMAVVLKGREEDIRFGLAALGKLTDGKLYVCKDPETLVSISESEKLQVVEFSGPHPAGNPGTHIHFLDPVYRDKTVWWIQAQDLLALGHLFRLGRLEQERVVALSGAGVKEPRLIRVRRGADLQEIVRDELKEGDYRLISGSVLHGRTAVDVRAFLGRYHQQISVIPEGRQRTFAGWLSPMAGIHSVKNVVLSRLFPKRLLDLTTAMNGGLRAIVPSGSYEKVMPLDMLPTFLLRSLAVNDVEQAEKLGCLELDEEDLALCTYVCPSKIDHGMNLRETLNLIEKEG